MIEIPFREYLGSVCDGLNGRNSSSKDLIVHIRTYIDVWTLYAEEFVVFVFACGE